MPSDINLINLLMQGGFAAMFVWLLIDTRRESNDREKRLTALLEQYAANLPAIAASLNVVEKCLERIEARK